jgi:hypothetical protein
VHLFCFCKEESGVCGGGWGGEVVRGKWGESEVNVGLWYIATNLSCRQIALLVLFQQIVLQFGL